MKQFIQTNNKKFTFSTCEICPARCCNGKEGTVFAQILLEDFQKIYKNFPILFIFGELGYIKPVVLLTNGKKHCDYLKDYKCTIYNERPSICQTYPLSANIDDQIYIDLYCPAINDNENRSITIIENSKITTNFDNPVLHDYQDKYINTHFEMEKFNNKVFFSKAIEINGIEFYKCDKTYENNYMKMHQQSLIHLQKEYFTN